MKKALDLWKKSETSNTQALYTFDAAKIEEIIDFLLKEKFITFPKDHQLPSKEEIRAITVLILVGVPGILSRIGSTREY